MLRCCISKELLLTIARFKYLYHDCSARYNHGDQPVRVNSTSIFVYHRYNCNTSSGHCHVTQHTAASNSNNAECSAASDDHVTQHTAASNSNNAECSATSNSDGTFKQDSTSYS